MLATAGLTVYTQVSARDNAVITGGSGSTSAEFRLQGDGTIRSDGKCLTAPSHAIIGTPALALRGCDGSAYQRWSTLGGKVLLNELSAMCLNALPSGSDIWAYPCGAIRQDPQLGPPAASQATTPEPGASEPKTPSPAAKSGKVDPSGAVMPQGDLPGWRQVFADDFGQNVPLGSFPDAVSGRWGGYDGSRDTSKNGLYAPDRVVSVGGGVMNLNLHTENGTHLVAAPVPKLAGADRGGGMLYGRYAVRFRADAVPGYKTAWLLWPDSDNWPDGEIDFPEGSLNERIMAFAHQVGDPAESTPYSAKAKYTAWHTAIIEWTPNHLDFIMDGKVIGHVTDKSHIPSVPMHWVLQTETDLGDMPPSDSAQGNVQIDWVAAWARN